MPCRESAPMEERERFVRDVLSESQFLHGLGRPVALHGRRASADAGYPTYRIPRRLVAAITTVDQR